MIFQLPLQSHKDSNVLSECDNLYPWIQESIAVLPNGIIWDFPSIVIFSGGLQESTPRKMEKYH